LSIIVNPLKTKTMKKNNKSVYIVPVVTDSQYMKCFGAEEPWAFDTIFYLTPNVANLVSGFEVSVVVLNHSSSSFATEKMSLSDLLYIDLESSLEMDCNLVVVTYKEFFDQALSIAREVYEKEGVDVIPLYDHDSLSPANWYCCLEDTNESSKENNQKDVNKKSSDEDYYQMVIVKFIDYLKTFADIYFKHSVVIDTKSSTDN
jgi:hypothetical protein